MSSVRRVMRSITRLCSSYKMSQYLDSNPELIKHQPVVHEFGYRYLINRNYTRSTQNLNKHTRNFSAYSEVQQGAPLPSQPPPSSLKWILGIMLTVVVPVVTNKGGPLLQFKNEVDTTIETIEEIVIVVENVAEVVDEVAEGISGHLPQGGKLKNLVDLVEDVAEVTAKDAHTVGHAIDEFQEVEGKVENIVGSFTVGANVHSIEPKAGK